MLRFMRLMCLCAFVMLSGCATMGGIFFAPTNPAAAWANLQSVLEREIKLTGDPQPAHFSVGNAQAIEAATRALSAAVGQGQVFSQDLQLSIQDQNGMRVRVACFIRAGGDGVHHADQAKRNGTSAALNQQTNESIVLIAGGKGFHYTGNERDMDKNGGNGGDAKADLSLTDPANHGHGNLVFLYGGKGGKASKVPILNLPWDAGALPAIGRNGGNGGDTSLKFSGNNQFTLKGADGGDGGPGGNGWVRAGDGGKGGSGGSAAVKGGASNAGSAVAGKGGNGGVGGKVGEGQSYGGNGGTGGSGGSLTGSLGSGSTLNGNGSGAPAGSFSGGGAGGAGNAGHGSAGSGSAGSAGGAGGARVQIAP